MDVLNSGSVGISDWWMVVSEAGIVLLCLLVGYSLLLLYRLRKPGDRQLPILFRSLRGRLLFAMVLLALLPATSLGLVLTQRSLAHTAQRSEVLLEQAAHSVARSVELFLDKHRVAVVDLAQTLEASESFESASIEHWLTVRHRSYPDFLTMLAANSRAEVVAATYLQEGRPRVRRRPVTRIDDRSYFRHPMADGRPYLSQVFQGRGLGNDIITAVSAVVRRADGTHWGIVEGSLDLRSFARFEKPHADEVESSIVILDVSAQVVYASPQTGLQPLQDLSGHYLAGRPPDGSPGAFVFKYLTADRGREYSYFASAATIGNGWRVVAMLPVDAILAEQRYEVKFVLIWIASALAVALLLAWALAHSIRAPIEQLSEAVSELDAKDDAAVLSVPRRTPTEFEPVFRHLEASRQRLRDSYLKLDSAFKSGEVLRAELKRVLLQREGVIEERTKQLREANAELKRLHHQDSLTGISNRRKLSVFLPRVWNTSSRQKVPLSVLMIDLDRFKSYNDRYGHLAGDQCLKSIGATMAQLARRPFDLAVRYGGEEFLILLFDTNLSGALAVAERLREQIESLEIRHQDSPTGYVTASVGVCSMTPEGDRSPDECLLQADQALYAAKQTRNRTAYMERQRIFLLDSMAVGSRPIGNSAE